MTSIYFQRISPILSKSTKFIVRDFLELGDIQSSSNSQMAFATKSYAKAKERISDDLEKAQIGFVQFSDFKKKIDKEGIHIFVNPIDSIYNLSRALPFFGSVVTIVEFKNGHINPLFTMISLPASNEFFYAEKNAGAWYEKISSDSGAKTKRLRTSKTKSSENPAIALASRLDQEYLKNSYLTHSHLYNISGLASGKFDVVITSAKDFSISYSAMLFAIETGGKYYNLKNSDYLVASNIDIPEID